MIISDSVTVIVRWTGQDRTRAGAGLAWPGWPRCGVATADTNTWLSPLQL